MKWKEINSIWEEFVWERRRRISSLRPVQIFYIQGGIDWDKLQSRRFKISAGEDEPVNGGVVNSRVVNGGNRDLFLDPVMKFWWSRIVINIRWRVEEIIM